jgi:spermidine synthase
MAAFEESQPWGFTTYDVVPGTHVSFSTARQQVDLITNPCFGRILFLDGILQSASKDEAMYHRALIQPVERMQAVEKVLILGGAEGAAAREVFHVYPDVKRVVMVDWDAELVAWMREREAGEAERAAFADPRLTIVAEDANVFLSTADSFFDAVFIDLLDPDMDTWEWLAGVLMKAAGRLSPDGILTVNLGSNRIIIKKLIAYLHQICYQWKIVPYTIFVPSFQEPWYLAYITQSPVQASQNLTHASANRDLPVE